MKGKGNRKIFAIRHGQSEFNVLSIPYHRMKKDTIQG
jgi:hypothetical protein